MQTIFALISAQLGIRKRLVRRLNQPMTARLMKTARSLKIPHEIGQILCSASASAQIPRRYLGSVRSMKRSFHWSNAVTWCAMWKTTNVVSGDEWTEDFDAREIEQFVCILILFCIGEKDTAKRKTVTITSRKNIKQTKESKYDF